VHNDVSRAIRDFNEIIERDLSAADSQIDLLHQLQIDRKVTFGGRPLAHSLRPVFLTEYAYQEVQDTVYLLRQAILNVAERHFNRREVLEQLGLEEWEIEFAAIPTNVRRLAATARMDAFLTADSFKFVEVNAESPAGMAYVHHLGAIYRELPIFQSFHQRHPVRFVSPLEHLVAGLIRIYHEEFSGVEELPTFAIVDHLNVPTYNEFLLVKDYLEKRGMPCIVSDPRDLECRDGWIFAEGRRIDILYRRLLINEGREIETQCPAYMEGYRAQKTCYLNSFRTKLVHKKALFALLTDLTYTHDLHQQQLSAIREHIPWTRRLADTSTSGLDWAQDGRPIPLLDFVLRNRDRLVIKPNDEYGGKDVTIGPAVTDAEWHRAIETGLKGGYVVQEAVNISREDFFVRRSGSWLHEPTIVDLDPYLNGPLMGGCLTRTSTSALANVTAGGGTLPLFILRYD
jgi:uncharacterized circularly permuted ATP-grasp superfamily protein